MSSNEMILTEILITVNISYDVNLKYVTIYLQYVFRNMVVFKTYI